MAQNEATLLIRIKQAGQEVFDELKSRLVITAGDVANFVKSVAGSFIEFAASAVNAYKESELASNELSQAMMNQGVFTQKLKNDYLDMADALAAVTTFQDDQIVSAQAVLQSMVGERKVTQELIQATADLAAFKKMDLVSAANLVGKAIANETDVLGRQGIHVKQTTDDFERYGNVIEAIEGKAKGLAQTQAQGLGSIEQAKNAWNNFLENTGRLLAPFVEWMAKATTATLNFFNAFMNKDPEKTLSQINKEIDLIKGNLASMQKTGGQFANTDSYKMLEKDLQNQLALLEAHKAKLVEKENESKETAKAAQRQKFEELKAERSAQTEQEILDLAIKEQLKTDTELAAQVARLDAIIANEESNVARLEAIRQKNLILKGIANKMEVKSEEQKQKEIEQSRAGFLSHMASLENSSNQTLATIGKAAAIAQITIATGKAAMDGYAWGMAIGGPALAAVFSGLAYAAGAAQVAKVSGVALAEGGIVRATPGGVPAIIGEGGQDEAVIPLDRAGEMGFGGGSATIVFNGPILADESQAMAFAKVIDKSLLKLRQTGQSVAFETDIF